MQHARAASPPALHFDAPQSTIYEFSSAGVRVPHAALLAALHLYLDGFEQALLQSIDDAARLPRTSDAGGRVFLGERKTKKLLALEEEARRASLRLSAEFFAQVETLSESASESALALCKDLVDDPR